MTASQKRLAVALAEYDLMTVNIRPTVDGLTVPGATDAVLYELAAIRAKIAAGSVGDTTFAQLQSLQARIRGCLAGEYSRVTPLMAPGMYLWHLSPLVTA